MVITLLEFFHWLLILIGEKDSYYLITFIMLFLLIKNYFIIMDTFFDLFNKTDLENINKILITEKDKVFKIYKDLKDSIYLAQLQKKSKI